jgi:YidC/Oxa1 family membrane protein insertase
MSISPVIGAFASMLNPITGSLSGALAIVVVTLLVRLAITPLTYLQIRSGRRREALAGELARLREQHAGDSSALATETLALYRDRGIRPLAGLLPGLIQWPFFAVMYRAAYHAPAGALFGVPLSAHLTSGWPIFAVLLVIAGVVGWASARRLTSYLRVLPLLTVLTVAWLPLAGALYLVTSTTFTLFEQAFWRRPVFTGNS